MERAMRKGDRSKTKASRAARAQELLISSSQNVAKPAAFGFGGFSGSQQIVPASQITAAAFQSSPLLPHGDLDAEVAQRLRQLSKKDASTKVKALQALKVLLGERPAEEIEGILLAWTKPFQRLVMDNDRSVRMETASFMAVLAPMAGRTLAKALKSLAGPWWLAQSDPDCDCSSTFKAVFLEVFPAAKQREALAFCCTQVLDCLERNVRSKPADLSELHKEDIDELEERHERVVAASLRAMGTLLDVLLPAGGSEAPDEAAQEAVGRAMALFLDQDMVKRLMGLKGSVLIRSCSYSLLSIICNRAPSIVEQHKKQLAPQFFGGLNDKDALTHACMWDMVLSFVKAVPTAWSYVDVQKAIIPRLLALLRNACYGSAEVSSPAILPFLAQMPRGSLGPDSGVMCQILGAMWQGWQMAGSIGGARAALALCYTETLVWAMSRSQQLAGEKYVSYCDKLLGSASITANALNTTSASNSAADTLLKLAQDLSSPGMPPWILRLFLSHVERALSAHFAQQPVPSHYFDRGLMLLQRIAAILEKTDSKSVEQRQAWLAELVCKPLREGVLEAFGDQEMPAAAAHLLAYLLHPSKDGPKGGADLTPGAALAMFVSGPSEGPSATALADLLLATVQRCETPAKQIGIIATNLVCAPTSHSGSTDSMASLASSTESSDFEPYRANGRKGEKHLCGNLLHLLTLVKQLTDTLENSGASAKDWRSPRLDAVAHLLLQKRLADDDGAWQVLAALMIGDGSSALLSNSALSSALDVLASHTPQAWEDKQDTELEADVAAVNALDAVLFSRTVLVDANQNVLRPAALRALVAFFHLVWIFGRPDAGSMMDGEDEEVLGEPAVSRVVRLADIAKRGWNSGLRLAQISKDLAPDMRAGLRRVLLHSVVDSVDKDTELVQRAVSAAQSIITAACTDADDKDDVLDTLLRPRHGWPQYVHLEGDGVEKAKGAIESTSGRPETLSELAYALGTGLGFNSILYDADGRNRVWLVAELLCFSEGRTGAGAAELQSFLAEKGRLLDLPGVTAPRSGLLDGTLDRLLNGALGFGTGVCDREVYAHALCSLLREVISGSDRAAAAAHGFLRSSLAGPRLAQLPADLLLNILDSVASSLRGLDGREPAVEASGLAGLAEQLLKNATNLPPLMAAVANHSSRVDSCLTSLDLVVRCFPVNILEPPGEAASRSNERGALIALWQRQLAGYRAVKAAAAAERRTGEPIVPTDTPRRSHGSEAAAALAKLSTCVVAYCWQQLDAGQWAFLLAHAKEGVAAAAVIMEEQAEAVVRAGRKAATVIAGARETVASDIALAILRRLSLLQSTEAAQKLESAVQGMVTELACEQSFEQLCKLGEGWLRVLALALDIITRFVADCDLPRDWHQKLTEVLSEALRLLFAAGICTAFIVAAGQRATDLAAMYFEESAMIWTAVSRAAEAALTEGNCLADSIKAIDTWAADTGVDAFTSIFAMMLASYSHNALQSACLQLLISPILLQRVASAKNDEDEDEVEQETTASGQEHSALVEAGVHAQVAAVICGVIGDVSSFSVTWALVLARLLSMAGPARRRVAQAFGDFDELITRLMEDLVPLLPLEETPTRRGRGPNAPSPSPPQLSAAQRAAQAAQTRADGSAWSLTKELAMLGVPGDEEGDRRLSMALYRGVLSALPASAKSWFGRLNNRSLESAIEAYTAAKESPHIISAELGGVSGVATSDVADTAEFRMRASLASREAVAILCIEESSTLEMVIKLPASWPLRPAEVECRRRVGVAEGRLRKWLLSIAAFMRNQNGTLADAMALWRDNCVREFSGVEECLICYSVVATSDGQLPRLKCQTCCKRFHKACLYKWFRSSGKSVCPHCQSPW